jgi:peptidoglycan/xylan/chitin deacetylase (PgdA/CDA1 family)
MNRAVRIAATTVARPIATGARVARRTPRLTVLGWHRIDDSGSSLSTPVAVFERQLDVLESSGAVVLALTDAVQRLTAHTLPDRAVVLTFDDGYASALERAWPKLRERGLPATLFLVSGYLTGRDRFPWDAAERGDHTRLADADAVRTAAHDGLDIGSHTVSHSWLPHLSDGGLAVELTESRRAISDLVDRPVDALAYPVGGWDRRVRDAAAAAGYSTAITVDRGVNGPLRDRLALRRSFAPDTVSDFELVMSEALTWLRPLDRWRTRKGPRW